MARARKVRLLEFRWFGLERGYLAVCLRTYAKNRVCMIYILSHLKVQRWYTRIEGHFYTIMPLCIISHTA